MSRWQAHKAGAVDPPGDTSGSTWRSALMPKTVASLDMLTYWQSWLFFTLSLHDRHRRWSPRRWRRHRIGQHSFVDCRGVRGCAGGPAAPPESGFGGGRIAPAGDRAGRGNRGMGGRRSGRGRGAAPHGRERNRVATGRGRIEPDPTGQSHAVTQPVRVPVASAGAVGSGHGSPGPAYATEPGTGGADRAGAGATAAGPRAGSGRRGLPVLRGRERVEG